MNALAKPSTESRLSCAFAHESIEQVWIEIVPLLKAHWDELAYFRDIPLKPRFEKYEQAAAQGHLRIFTARIEGHLVGYAIYFVDHHLHYGESLHAFQDVLFLHPHYRRGGVGYWLIRYADNRLKQEGVQVVVQHVKAQHDLAALLERLGYTLMDHLYAKRLD